MTAFEDQRQVRTKIFHEVMEEMADLLRQGKLTSDRRWQILQDYDLRLKGISIETTKDISEYGTD